MLAVAVCLVYVPAIDSPFIFDDVATVKENPSIVALWPLIDRSGEPSPLAPGENSPVSARPLANLSLAVNYHFSQLDPRGYHATNIALHILTALVLWAIVARTLSGGCFAGRIPGAGWLAFATAVVWAVHPLASEAVEYITQRTELLAGLFYLLALYAAIGYWSTATRAGRVGALLAAALASVLGALSKEMIATLPAIALLYERTFLTGTFRGALRRSWPLYATLAIGCWLPLVAINWHGPRTPLVGFDLGISAQAWWYTQCEVLFQYLKLAVWPWPLVIHYEMPYLDTLAVAWPWVVAAGVFDALTAVLVWRRRAVGFALAWVLVILSPTFVVPLASEVMAERRMYLPLMALAALFVFGTNAVVRRLIRRLATTKPAAAASGRAASAFTLTIAAAVAIALGLVTTHRLEAYRDELTLWRDAERYQPNNPLVHVNEGILLEKAGQLDEAFAHFERAVELNPESFQAQYNLGRALEELGRPLDAKEHYEIALRIKPDLAAAHTNLGRLLTAGGQPRQAMLHYEMALRVQPRLAEAHDNLAILLIYAGRTDEAIEHFEAACATSPALRVSRTWPAATLRPAARPTPSQPPSAPSNWPEKKVRTIWPIGSQPG